MQWTAMATAVIAEDGELSLQLGRHHCCEALTMVYLYISRSLSRLFTSSYLTLSNNRR